MCEALGEVGDKRRKMAFAVMDEWMDGWINRSTDRPIDRSFVHLQRAYMGNCWVRWSRSA